MHLQQCASTSLLLRSMPPLTQPLPSLPHPQTPQARQQAEAAAAAAGEASAGEGQEEAPKRELRRRK